MEGWSDSGTYHPVAEWSLNLSHAIEGTRGMRDRGDAWSPGWFEFFLNRGNSVTLVLCADLDAPPADHVAHFAEHRRRTLTQPRKHLPRTDSFGRQLLAASSAFLAHREGGSTVIAGYPWFLDWGRDSLIAARGLLAAGRLAEVRQLLIQFGRFEREGTLPNSIHGEDASNRDTSDAPLWYGVVCEDLALAPGAAGAPA